MKQMWCIFDKLLIKCQNIYNHSNRIAVRQSHTIRRQSASIVWPEYKCMVRTLKNQRYYLMKLLIRLAVARHAFIWWVFFFYWHRIRRSWGETCVLCTACPANKRWAALRANARQKGWVFIGRYGGRNGAGRSVGRPDSRVGAWVTTHYCSPFFPSAKSSPATCIIPALMFYGFLLIRSKKNALYYICSMSLALFWNVGLRKQMNRIFF